MERIAIVQVYINGPVPKLDADRRNDLLVDQSVMDFKHYAHINNYEHVFVTEPKFHDCHPQMEIFQILDKDEYDRIITVDVDVTIQDLRHDIIEHSHPTGLSACWRPDGGDNINSGVLVWGKEARKVFRETYSRDDIAAADTFKNRDQDLINMFVKHYPANRITSKFNDYTFAPDSYWWHYKGGSKLQWQRT